MTPVNPPDLPLLTDIVNIDGVPDAIPILTEVVPAQAFEQLAALTNNPALHDVLHQHPETLSIARLATELIWNAPATVAQPATPPERDLNEEERQQLIDHFEAYLEYVFTTKLNRHLDQLHRQAVKLAISEFKSELPELLRKAISKPDSSQ